MNLPTADAVPLDRDRVARAAAALFEARRRNGVLEALAHDCIPASFAEAFAVQRKTTELVGKPIGGWKVGLLPNVRLTFAPIYQPAIHETPAKVAVTLRPAPVVEAEVAFRLSKGLPRRAHPYTPEEVAAAVESAHAAIEIGQPRLGNFYPAPMEHKIADNMGNGAMIWGTGTRAWRDLDRAHLPVSVRIDGKEVVKMVGGNQAGDPFDALVALANTPLKEEPLLAGQVIITGSCTGMSEAASGAHAEVEFVGLGRVEVDLTEAR
jgi:2-keto-4-pentenoate hydratase